MVNLLKMVLWTVIGIPVYLVVSIIDATIIGLMFLNRIIRTVIEYIVTTLFTEEDMEEVRIMTNFKINDLYKTEVDRLYPTEEI